MENPPQPGGIISPTQPPAGQPAPTPNTQPAPAPNVPPAPAQPQMQPAPQAAFQQAPMNPAAPSTQQPMAPAQAAPAQPMPAFMNAPSAAPVSASQMQGQKKSIKKKMVLPLVIIGALLIIGGGSAAAYFGYVVPNKPENKLLSAISNLATHKSVTIDGTVDYSPKSGGTGVAVDYKLALNSETSQVGLSGTVGVGGAKVPYEIRYIDKDLYFKASDLNGLTSLIPSSGADLDFSSIIKQVDGQWFVVDRSFTDSLGLKTSCVTDSSFALNDADVTLIKKAYKQHPLFTVKSSSSQTVDGEATTKYLVDPASDSEASAFASNLKGLSLYKKAMECSGSSSNSSDSSSPSTSAKNTTTGTVSIYVTKDNQLKKIEINGSDDSSSMKIAATFSYAEVKLDKPAGAKSVQDLYTSVLGGLGFGPTAFTDIQSSAKDVERKADINALHGQLEAYWAQKGYYPSLKDMNSAAFISANFKGLDQEALTDPDGSGTTFTVAPQKNAYTYTVQPSGCDNATKTQCVSYVLSAMNTDGTLYSKQSLN
ncbi:MAG: hypothetical protein JWO47_531 [Candidatus Saccharibacteria bacterium]|nr:hypothetical protein [Candidatus Saccharibacteria bacterium]